MKRRMVVTMTALMTALSLAACGAPREDAPAAPAAGVTNPAVTSNSANPNAKVVKYSTVFAASGLQADGAKALGELINESSNGKLNMEFYPSGQLGDKSATLEGLQAGTIEMTECSASDLSAYNDQWSVFSLPYLWDSGDQAIATVTDPAVADVLEKDMEKNGFKIIAWTNVGARSFMNDKKTVKTVSDLKGLKIRTMQDKVLADSVSAMGAIGTPMAFSDVYTALQQGTIDGFDYNPAGVVSSDFQEVCKFYSLTEHFIIPDPVFVSKSWFDALSEEDQKAILDAGEKFTKKWNEELEPEADQKALDQLTKDGVEVTEVDKASFKEAVQPVVDKFLDGASEGQKELYNLLQETKKNYE